MVTTLFVAEDAPYPPRSGTPLRTWQNINVMASLGPVHLFSIGMREDDAREIPIVASWEHVESSSVPGAKRTLASRLLGLIRPQQYPRPYDSATARINRKLRDLIERIKPDVVVLSHWHESCPAPVKAAPSIIADSHNIESVLAPDLMRLRHRLTRFGLRMRLYLWRRRRAERRLLRRADRIWVTGEVDAASLRTLDTSLQPVVWPNAVDTSFYAGLRDGTTDVPAGMSRNGATLLYAGMYSYLPNEQAAHELIDRIMPLVWNEFPEARLLLVGKGPTPEMLATADADPRIVVTGGVADVRPFLALADVCVVPLAEGGGTRMKIIEAFASRIPVVASPKGAEGLAVENGEHLMIASDARASADAAIMLLRWPEKRSVLAQNAFDLVERSYSWQSLERRLSAALPQKLHACATIERSAKDHSRCIRAG